MLVGMYKKLAQWVIAPVMTTTCVRSETASMTATPAVKQKGNTNCKLPPLCTLKVIKSLRRFVIIWK
jgi:hypothetical protein